MANARTLTCSAVCSCVNTLRLPSRNRLLIPCSWFSTIVSGRTNRSQFSNSICCPCCSTGRFVVLFLLPGHLHNQANQVVADLCNSMRKLDLFIPSEIIATWNAVKSVEAVSLDHDDPNRPFVTGWEPLLSKYFKHMPANYTKNLFFEIDSGVCTINASSLQLSRERSSHVPDDRACEH